MTRTAAIVVNVDAASGGLPAELQHHFAAMTQAVAIVLDWLASAERQAEATAVRLKTARDGAAARDVIQAAREVVGQSVDVLPELRLSNRPHEGQAGEDAWQRCVERAGVSDVADRLEVLHQLR